MVSVLAFLDLTKTQELDIKYCMPRIARIVAEGLPHHITQRGNRKAMVFLDDKDREAYLGLLRKYCIKHNLEVLAYCLMSNHIHLIAIPLELMA
jgi:putative transposase